MAFQSLWPYSQLMCTNEAQHILAICHVTGTIWTFFKIVRPGYYSPTQKPYSFCSLAGSLGVATLFILCGEKSRLLFKKKKPLDEIVFHLEGFVHEAWLESKHLHTLLRDFWCLGSQEPVANLLIKQAKQLLCHALVFLTCPKQQLSAISTWLWPMTGTCHFPS